MQQLRLRVGPYASCDRLLYHLRSARGKIHWAGELAYACTTM